MTDEELGHHVLAYCVLMIRGIKGFVPPCSDLPRHVHTVKEEPTRSEYIRTPQHKAKVAETAASNPWRKFKISDHG